MKGGLGNQLFQYSTAKFLAQQNNSPLVLDISSFEVNKYTDRKLSILDLNLDEGISIKETGKLTNLLKKIPYIKNKFVNNIIETEIQEFNYSELKYVNGKINILSGYFQSYKYFHLIKESLVKDLKPKIKSYKLRQYEEEINSKQNTISLHVRRGDYVKLGWDLDVTYYMNALEILSEKLNLNKYKNGELFVFSDDIEWCKKIFIRLLPNNFKIIFVEDNELNDYEELYLMSICEHNIISNSTFSWWAGWLNQNHEKYVVAPEKWIKENTIQGMDLIPEEWIVVEREKCE